MWGWGLGWVCVCMCVENCFWPLNCKQPICADWKLNRAGMYRHGVPTDRNIKWNMHFTWFVLISSPCSSADVSDWLLQNPEIEFVSWRFTWPNYYNVGCGLGSGCAFRTSLSILEEYVYFPLEEERIHVLFQWDYQVSAAPPKITTFGSCRCNASSASRGGPSTYQQDRKTLSWEYGDCRDKQLPTWSA